MHAADDVGARFFESGRVAFAAANYPAALEAFEAALDAKFVRPALHFNIGVTAYRLGRYERARQAFLEAARTPEMAALAHYNLGLVALGGGDPADAAQWFAQCKSETRDERLLTLATTQLERLAAKSEPALNWSGYAALAAGYDDNVALVSNSDVLDLSGRGDAFVDGQFAAAFPVGESWRFDAGAMLLAYQDMDQFNQITAYGGGRYRLALGDWMADVGAQLAHGTLGGDSFQNVQTAQLQGSTALSPEWRLRLRYRLSNIDGMGDFTAIGGTRQEASARLTWETNAWRIGTELGLENSDLNDESLSMTRPQLAVSIERPLNAAWIVACELAQSRSNFDVDASGSENRTDTEVSIARVMASNWRIVLRYAYADNEATRSDFNYSHNRIALGIEGTLPGAL